MRVRPPARRRLAWLLLGATAVLLIAVAIAALLVTRQPGDVSNPDVAFDSREETVTVPQPDSEDAGTGELPFNWANYAFTKQRTSYLPLRRPLRPPFAERWKVTGSVLLEFPPAMGKRSLFLLKNNGALYGITRKTGKVRWKRKLGFLAASSPAYAHNTVFAVLLARGKGVKAGRVVAVSAKDGHTRWARRLPSRAESSPLVDRGTLYFGSEDGTIYALRARDGFIRWRAKASGAVKGGLALDHGRLFAGDYGGKVQALRARDGKVLWRSGGASSAFGLHAGNFYATPAAAHGRVYIGNTDGFVYSFAQQSGKLAWRKRTGGYVYSSAAVADAGGTPTVFVGSYDRAFYALDARTGAVRWKHRADGRISGGAVVLGDLVFFSTLKHTTTALGTATGQPVWSTRRGAFTPVVSNGRGIFLLGFTNLYGLDARPPRRAGQTAAQAARRARFVARRVAARRRAIRRRNRLRRSGIVFCYRSGGHRVCRRPAALVCVHTKRATVCRPRHKAARRR